jgi:hypothetical protein
MLANDAFSSILSGLFVALLVALGVAIAVVVGLIPGKIARDRNHARANDVRTLGLIGLVIPFCWIAALIWAAIGKQSAPVKNSSKPVYVPKPAGYAGAQSLSYAPAEEDTDSILARELDNVGVEQPRQRRERYIVKGADRTTGQDVVRSIDANNKAEAEQIASRSMLIAEIKLEKGQRPRIRTCENCGASIGKLEQSRDWQGNEVCYNCFSKLKAQAAPVA